MMPSDYRCQIVYHGERPYMVISEDSICGVAKSKSTNQNVGRIGSEQGHRDVGERDFRYREIVRHQMLVIQDNLNHIAIKLQDAPPSQHQFTKWRVAVVKFLEQMRHIMLSAGRGTRRSGGRIVAQEYRRFGR